MKEPTDKLEPCPFCGGDGIMGAMNTQCTLCRAMIDRPEGEQAAAQWNHRPIEDQLRADKAELVEALEELLESLTGPHGEHCRTDAARKAQAAFAKHGGAS